MLVRVFALCFVSMVSVLPCRADSYLVFRDGATVSNEVWTGDKPIPGVNIPDGSFVKLWVPESGDNEPSHYVRAVSGLRRFVEVPTVDAKPIPNPDGFYADLAASGEFSDEEFGQALRCRYISDEKLRDQKILQYAATLSQAQLAKLIELAQKHNIPLPLN